MPTVVLDVGDRDDHGENIYIAAAEDAVAWADGIGHVLAIGTDQARLADVRKRFEDKPVLIFYRLALTAEQAEELDVLDADGKAEAEAVPVPVMDHWLREAIESLQHPAGREELEAKQEVERARLDELIHKALDNRNDGSE